ncbi:hypothetical protein ACFWWU_36535 [Streptomyces sp. NPDC058650]|uniref:phage distal tail protein n=1 Tax=Streptomyces sp. NPDC058650 TaxID=3346575 RepID=UPI003665BA66
MISIALPSRTLVNVASSTEPYLRDLPGWLDSIAVQGRYEQRPASIGLFDDDEPESPGRLFTAFGEYRVPGGDWDALRRELTAYASLDAFDVTVSINGSEHTARVKVEGVVEFDLIDEQGYADFSIPLLAVDPRKYGPLQSQPTGLFVAGGGVLSPLTSPFTQIGGGNPGRVTITNQGNTETTPTFTVTGGLAEGFGILRIATGELIRCIWPLVVGDTARVDVAEGQVWLNEQSPISGYLADEAWWTLGPGETTEIQFIGYGAVTGTPQLTVEWRDADA